MNREELLLLSSKEFNQILAEDREIIELEKLKYNNSDEKFLLLDALNLGNFRIGKLPIRPLTLAKWSFLSLLGSPYCREAERVTPADVDIFLYIVSQYELNSLDCNLTEIIGKASQYHFNTALSFEEAHVECLKLIEHAFYPLKMLEPNNSGESVHFGADWVIQTASYVSQVCNEPLQVIIHQMPLSTVFLLLVNYCRQTYPNLKIEKITDEDIAKKISERIDFLANEFLRRKNAGM